MARNSKQTKAQVSADLDHQLMLLAIAEAYKGAGFVKTNPMVGAVIAIGDKVLTKSYHARYGGAHAERRAIEQAKKKYSAATLRKATLYITLEPCSHVGKTPACLPLVESIGFKRVVIGALDPNPQEQGRGVATLKRSGKKTGTQVVTGVAKLEAEYLIRAFSKWITTHIPYVLGKIGMSLDAKITQPKSVRYITNDKALERVHELRQEFDAILVGVNTVIQDNPQLNTRLDRKKLSHPIKVVLDSRLRVPASSRLLDSNTIVACVENADIRRKKAIARTGADIIELPAVESKGTQLFDRMDVVPLLKELGKRGITSLLVEGGSYVFTNFINRKAIDEFQLFYAPHIFGATHLPFTYALEYTVSLDQMEVEQLDDNIVIRGYAKYS